MSRSRLILYLALVSLVRAPAVGYGAVRWAPLGLDVTVRALAVDPSAPTTLYAGTGGLGVFKSA